jgi:hypothetical protein
MKVIVEMDFDCDGFKSLSTQEKAELITSVLDSGAEATCSDILVHSVTMIRGELS